MPAFGTSGLRGRVTELDDATVAAWMGAFLVACPPDGPVFIGRDLRPSSPRIALAVMAAAEAAGVDTVDCGVLPTPALALAASGGSAVMVTGSHIQADCNGLKFYVPAGEISKTDEAAISAARAAAAVPLPGTAGRRRSVNALTAYRARYVQSYGATALAGLRLGVYQHSSVARDVIVEVLAALGAEVVALAWSETFIPVDTEAVDGATRKMLAGWCATHRLDAIVSTDADADRPVLTDARGVVVPGDILGVLTAQSLGATEVVTPVSSNSMVAELFDRVALTRIGSPFVIAGMKAALARDPDAKVVGFEANGGFLLGFAATGRTGPLGALMTRDSLLPILAPLAAARMAGRTLADSVAALPARVTAADRLQDIDRDKAGAFLARLDRDRVARAAFLAPLGTEVAVGRTDGLRMRLAGERVVHLRPSGNAPEFRVYVEAATPAEAQGLLVRAMERLGNAIG